MGFFSAIKKMFGGAEDAANAAQEVPAEIDAEAGAAAPESLAEPAARPASEATAQPFAASAAEEALTLRLREAEPRLSVWLGIVLEGVDEAGDLLWQRLFFLLRALDAPEAEAQNFVRDFQEWLTRMDYRQVEEFRSELQYRLALALDMEDEEDERNRLFLKISQGLSRTREQFSKGLDALFAGHGELDDAFWEELEELFIMADLGYEPSIELVERLKERARKEKVTESTKVRQLLMAEVEEIFRAPRRIAAVNQPEVVLMIGVNGVGKTTTIAKLAHRDRMQGKKVMIAAADTFRAAAIEQLQVWAGRVGALPAGKDGATVQADADELYDFILDRLKGYYADKGVTVQQFNAVAAMRPKSLFDLDRRIDAIGTFDALPEAEALAAADKRIRNILRKADGTVGEGVDATLLVEPAEQALASAVEAAWADAGPALENGDYVAALARLARLRPEVDAFFDGVMVNADDAALRGSRLALLTQLSVRLGSVAAIEHLSG